jgi:hypothetical protein
MKVCFALFLAMAFAVANGQWQTAQLISGFPAPGFPPGTTVHFIGNIITQTGRVFFTLRKAIGDVLQNVCLEVQFDTGNVLVYNWDGTTNRGLKSFNGFSKALLPTGDFVVSIQVTSGTYEVFVNNVFLYSFAKIAGQPDPTAADINLYGGANMVATGVEAKFSTTGLMLG